MASEGDGVTPSLGSYKGVMLCNRPLGSDSARVPVSVGDAPFRVGVLPEFVHPGGKNLQLEHAMEMMPPVEREETVLDRHKRWLKQIEGQRAALLQAAAEAQARREDKKKKFAESQKAFRDLVRSQPVGSTGTQSMAGVHTGTHTTGPAGDSAPGSPRATGRDLSPRPAKQSLADAAATAAERLMAAQRAGAPVLAHLPSSSSSASDGEEERKIVDEHKGSDKATSSVPSTAASTTAIVGAKAALKKPAWARSERVQEALEEAEADELLSFANELDYDRYVDTLDTKTEDDFLSSQLKELEKAEHERRQEISRLEAAIETEKAREERRRRREERAARAAESGVIEGASALEDDGKKKKKKGKKGKKSRRRKQKDETIENAKLLAQLIAGAAAVPPSAPVSAASSAPAAPAPPRAGGPAESSTVASSKPKAQTTATPRASVPTSATAGPADADAKKATGPRFLVGGGGHTRRPQDDESTSSSDSESDDAEDSDEFSEDDSDMETLDTLGSLRVPRSVRVRPGDDASSIASSVLSSASSLRGIHSKRSLAAVIDRQQKELNQHIAQSLAAGVEEEPVAPPRIVVVPDNPGALAEKKALVSLLPYQHRNPAV